VARPDEFPDERTAEDPRGAGDDNLHPLVLTPGW
jgi:hypothetical protein